MPARSVQVSIDEDLLREIDRHRVARAEGRSALVRRAVQLYFELERRREIDRAYAKGYGGKADEVWDEFSELLSEQRWPSE